MTNKGKTDAKNQNDNEMLKVKFGLSLGRIFKEITHCENTDAFAFRRTLHMQPEEFGEGELDINEGSGVPEGLKTSQRKWCCKIGYQSSQRCLMTLKVHWLKCGKLIHT